MLRLFMIVIAIPSEGKYTSMPKELKDCKWKNCKKKSNCEFNKLECALADKVYDCEPTTNIKERISQQNWKKPELDRKGKDWSTDYSLKNYSWSGRWKCNHPTSTISAAALSSPEPNDFVVTTSTVLPQPPIVESQPQTNANDTKASTSTKTPDTIPNTAELSIKNDSVETSATIIDSDATSTTNTNTINNAELSTKNSDATPYTNTNTINNAELSTTNSDATPYTTIIFATVGGFLLLLIAVAVGYLVVK